MTFEELYSAYYECIYRYVYRWLESHEPSEDTVQETFIKLYSCLNSGMEIENPRAWLYKVASNLCKNKVKRSALFREIIKEKMAVGTDRIDPEDDIIKRDKIERIRNALNGLPVRDRMLVQLYGDGLSYAEMAEITGINVNSVGKTLSRAINKVAGKLKEDNIDEMFKQRRYSEISR